jgi:hydroxyethylthiazole kinase-like uncharacterized protein yjeF
MNGAPQRVRVHTAAQVRNAEKPVLDAGVPLMLYAARELGVVVARELIDPGVTARLNDLALEVSLREPLRGRLLVLAGSGDNGGDALYAAASLLQWTASRGVEGDDLRADVLLTGSKAHARALATAEAAGARVIPLAEAVAGEYDLIIDGILGIGTSSDPALRGNAREAVQALLPAALAGRTRVIACDLPSGLHPDEGTTVDGVVLPASVTVTFGGVKAGLTRGRGTEFAGAVVWVDFDLPFDEPPVGAAAIAYALSGLPDGRERPLLPDLS